MPDVFGIILSPDLRVAANLPVVFRMVDSPRPASGAVFTDQDVRITTTTGGFFNQPLAVGRYLVFVGTSRRRVIDLQANPDRQLLQDLLGVVGGSIGDQGVNYRQSNKQRQLLNGDAGTWHTYFVQPEDDTLRLAFSGDTVGGSTPQTRDRDGMFEILSPSTSTWHAPFLSDGDFNLADSDAIPFANRRVIGGREQIYDTIQQKWATWFVTGDPGAETLGFGAPEDE